MNELWVAFYSDWSGFAIFTDEVKCLRYAVDHSMRVHKMAEGKDCKEQVNNWDKSS